MAIIVSQGVAMILVDGMRAAAQLQLQHRVPERVIARVLVDAPLNRRPG